MRLLRQSLRSMAVSAAFFGPAIAQAPATIGCAGPFARDADAAALIKAFGKANVEQVAIDVGEGMTEPGTVIFGKDPKRRIEVLWHDGGGRRRPSAITIREGSILTMALPFPEQRRLQVGMGLAEVEAINGRPFVIYGFGWDNGGYAGDWEGGALAKPGGGCSVSLRFDPDPKARGARFDKIQGDKTFTSSNPNMRAAKPTVSQLSLGWPQ